MRRKTKWYEDERFIIAMLLVLLILSGPGCSTAYVQAGAGIKLDGTDWRLLPRNAGGRNPTAWFAAGLRRQVTKRTKGFCEVNHWSHFRDGGPFNTRPETHKNEFRCGLEGEWEL